MSPHPHRHQTMRTSTSPRPFCRLRASPDTATLDRDLRGSAPPATIENPHPRRPGIADCPTPPLVEGYLPELLPSRVHSSWKLSAHCIALACLKAKEYADHCFRRGLATWAKLSSGLDVGHIKLFGRCVSRLEPRQRHGGVHYGMTERDRAVAVSSTIERRSPSCLLFSGQHKSSSNSSRERCIPLTNAVGNASISTCSSCSIIPLQTVKCAA
jgi:hypothetical protein